MAYSSCRRRFRIRADQGLVNAYHAICRQYDVPLDTIAASISGSNIEEPSVDFYRALLAEEWLNNMFSSLDGSGWRVNRPFDEGYADERGTVEPIGIGNRLLVRNNDGKPETEIDGFILLDGRHSAILEAKSGVNSYRWGDVIRKMKKIYEVTGARPGFVLAVPSDHLLLSNGWEDERNGFIWRGGMLIVFDAESSDFRDKAESLYLNAKQS